MHFNYSCNTRDLNLTLKTLEHSPKSVLMTDNQSNIYDVSKEKQFSNKIDDATFYPPRLSSELSDETLDTEKDIKEDYLNIEDSDSNLQTLKENQYVSATLEDSNLNQPTSQQCTKHENRELKTSDKTNKREVSTDTCGYTDNTIKKNHPSSPSLSYKLRPVSRLDNFSVSSSISQSEFVGFANLFIIIAIFFIFCNPIIRWYEKRQLFDSSLAKSMFSDFFLLMFLWLKLALWSFTSLYLHKLLLAKSISLSFHYVLQHLSQLIVVIYAISHCIYNHWAIIPSGFVQLVALVYFMKMHSYTETNRQFFLSYIKQPKQDKPDTDMCPYTYPNNLNLQNYVYYLFLPVLVYDLKFPTGQGFRLYYFMTKIFALLGAMIAMYIALTNYIMPIVLSSPQFTVIETIAKLILPLLSVELIVFYIIFECVCNLFAELTNFGDREFYQDWWNSTCWDEFSRKWNRPVHKFLLKHIYLQHQEKLCMSSRDATLLTYIFSALVHEMVLMVCFRLVRMYLFTMMLIQIPLIALGKYYKGTVYGNYVFWVGMLIGVPILTLLYGREWAMLQTDSIDHPIRFL